MAVRYRAGRQAFSHGGSGRVVTEGRVVWSRGERQPLGDRSGHKGRVGGCCLRHGKDFSANTLSLNLLCQPKSTNVAVSMFRWQT